MKSISARLDEVLDRLRSQGARDLVLCLSHDEIDELCGEMIEDLDAGVSVQYDGKTYRDTPIRAAENTNRSHVLYIPAGSTQQVWTDVALAAEAN